MLLTSGRPRCSQGDRALGNVLTEFEPCEHCGRECDLQRRETRALLPAKPPQDGSKDPASPLIAGGNRRTSLVAMGDVVHCHRSGDDRQKLL